MSRNVQSLERGLIVLEELVKRSPRGVTELAAELDLDKTIVYRLLSTLQMMGYITQDANRKYTVGAKLRSIGARVLSSLDVRTLALPYMHQLAEHTKGVSHLAKMAEQRAVYIERVQYQGFAVNSTPVGGEAPGYCSAAGKVLWANLTQTEFNQLLDRIEFRGHTVNTITTREDFQRHLVRVREQGYAIDREEHRLGLMGIGAPVHDHTGAVIASICVAEPASRSNVESLNATRDLVIEFAERLSSEMGYTKDEF